MVVGLLFVGLVEMQKPGGMPGFLRGEAMHA
jgi:hypothetical protein